MGDGLELELDIGVPFLVAPMIRIATLWSIYWVPLFWETTIMLGFWQTHMLQADSLEAYTALHPNPSPYLGSDWTSIEAKGQSRTKPFFIAA